MSDSAPPIRPVQRLKIGETVKTAYRGVFSSLGALYRAALLPFALGLVISVGQESLPEDAVAGQLALGFAGLVPYAIFAVAWHRFVLLGPGKGDPTLFPPFGRRHWRFIGALLLVFAGVIGTAAAVVAVPMLMAGLGTGVTGGPNNPGLAALLALLILPLSLAILYVTMRLSFVFPAISVDERYGFGDSWRNTKGQGWSLVGAVLLASLPIAGAGLVLTALLAGMLGGGQSGLVTAVVFFLVSAVIGYISSALTVSILSLAFRTCTGWYPGDEPGPPAPVESGDASY